MGVLSLSLSLSMCALSQKYWEILQEGKGKMQAASLLGKLSIRTVAAAGQPSDSALAAPVNRCDWHTDTQTFGLCCSNYMCFFRLSKSFFCRLFSCCWRRSPVDGTLRVLNVCVGVCVWVDLHLSQGKECESSTSQVDEFLSCKAIYELVGNAISSNLWAYFDSYSKLSDA